VLLGNFTRGDIGSSSPLCRSIQNTSRIRLPFGGQAALFVSTIRLVRHVIHPFRGIKNYVFVVKLLPLSLFTITLHSEGYYFDLDQLYVYLTLRLLSQTIRQSSLFFLGKQRIRKMLFAFPCALCLRDRAIYPSKSHLGGLEAVFQTAASVSGCAYQKTLAAIFLSVFEPLREVRKVELAGSL